MDSQVLGTGMLVLLMLGVAALLNHFWSLRRLGIRLNPWTLGVNVAGTTPGFVALLITEFNKVVTDIGLDGSVVWNPGSLADGVGETSAGITVTGAALGDFVLVAPPYDLQDMVCFGYVQAANTVEIRLQNEGAATVDLASGTWKVRVIPFTKTSAVLTHTL